MRHGLGLRTLECQLVIDVDSIGVSSTLIMIEYLPKWKIVRIQYRYSTTIFMTVDVTLDLSHRVVPFPI